MHDDFPEDEEPRGFFRRYRGLILAAVVIIAGISVSFTFGKSTKAAKKPDFTMVRITLPPPPPPPPPPPKPEPPPEPEVQEEKMIEAEPVAENEPEPEAAPDESPAADLSTGIVGNGPPDGFGLGGPGGGRGGNGLGGNGRGGSGNMWGRYGVKVTRSIETAMNQHRQASRVVGSVKVRIWPDDSGRITRARLAESTGNSQLDRVIENDVLTGLRLSEPPPADMPRPIVLRISGSRPN